MVFEKKKIQVETLSEYLTEVRRSMNLTMEQVAKKTGIKPIFFSALESGEFQILPADVYVLGFLRQLAQIYSVDSNELINQYRKEKTIQSQLRQRALSRSSPWPKKFWQRLVVTPKVVSLFLGLTFVVLTVAYIIWQLWSINKTPSLQIFEPANNAVVEGSFVNVRGRTDPGMTVTVNGQNIFVDSQGGFTSQLGLSPGPEQIVISVQNRFGKLTSNTLNITDALAADTGVFASELQLKLDFSGPVVLGITIDDQAEATMNFNKGDSKTFNAKSKIILSTSDAGATDITLNGQALGAMGRDKEQLTNISFFAQTETASTTLK